MIESLVGYPIDEIVKCPQYETLLAHIRPADRNDGGLWPREHEEYRENVREKRYQQKQLEKEREKHHKRRVWSKEEQAMRNKFERRWQEQAAKNIERWRDNVVAQGR